MPATTISLLNNLVKTIYGPALRRQLTLSSPAYKYFKSIGVGDVNWTKEGNGFTEGVLLNRNESYSALPELGNLPDSNFPKTALMLIPMKYHWWSISMSLQVMDNIAEGVSSFATPLKLQMDGITIGARAQMARMMWGDGRGALAQVSAAAAIGATTIAVDNPQLNVGAVGGAKFIRENMILAVFDPTDTTLVGMLTVTGVASTGLSFTVAATTFAIADNSILYHGNIATNTSATLGTSRNNECMGLRGMVNNAAGFQNYFSIDRAISPQMSSQVSDGSGGLSEDLLQRNFDAIQVLGDDEEGKVDNIKILCEHGVRRAYLAIQSANRRFMGEFTEKRDFASAAVQNKMNLTFGGFEIIADYGAPYGEMILFDKSGARMVEQKNEWVDKTGSIWNQAASPRNASFVADYTVWKNAYHLYPRACARITAIPATNIYIRRF